MPYIIRKKGNWWLTVNAETGKVKGRHETKKKATAQARLIMATEHNKTFAKKRGLGKMSKFNKRVKKKSNKFIHYLFPALKK